MGTHAAALGITAIAYYYARKHSDNPKSPDHYKRLLSDYNEMAHVTVEVNPCEGDLYLVEPEPPS